MRDAPAQPCLPPPPDASTACARVPRPARASASPARPPGQAQGLRESLASTGLLSLFGVVSVVGVVSVLGVLGGCAMPEQRSAMGQAADLTGPSTAPTGLVPRPAALLGQQVPQVPAALAQEVARFTEYAGHSLTDWHPTRPEMLVRHRAAGGNVQQLWRLSAAMATPQALTSGDEPVANAMLEPRGGRYIVLTRASGGNEAYQLERLDLDSGGQPGALTRLTDPDQRHSASLWLHQAAGLIGSSVPLDRTAAAGRRTQVDTSLWRMDPAQPDSRRVLATLPGTGWQAAALSRDDRQLALGRYLSANESQIWLMDLASGQRRQLLPAPASAQAGGAGAAAAAAPRATHFALAFSPGGETLYLLSDRASEFRELMQLDLASGKLTRLSAHLPWDVEQASLSHDGRLLALRVNHDGRGTLHLIDTGTGQELPLPAQAALAQGSVVQAEFHPRLPLLGLAVNSSQGPSQIYTLDLAAVADAGPAGAPTQAKTSAQAALIAAPQPVAPQPVVQQPVAQAWTRARLHPALDQASLTEQQIVRWTSFDGRSISGLLNRPPARFTGRRPVLISIHGGPEGQARFGFAGRSNFLLQELGIAVIQPNVRGSSGFGKTFLALDNGKLREDSVKDISALLDWIASQPDLDPQRVVVSGGSYGGYMSLAVASHYPQRIAGAIDVVGISHFVTFLESTETYRRDLRRVEYGDERDPEMRAFLHRISPLTTANRITKPLFVVQGKNDPRVPYTEAEQIVASVRAKGTPVWYLRAENEGHGFARQVNADYQFYATVLFLKQVLGL